MPLPDRLRRTLLGDPWRLLPLRGGEALLRLLHGLGWARLPPSPTIIPEPSAFDQAYRTITAWVKPWKTVGNGGWSDAYGAAHVPSPPTLVRHALGSIPDPGRFTFVDVGCGLGRAAIIASEFPFKAVLGVEKSPELYKLARLNAIRIRHDHPQRTPISIVKQDATQAPLPAGDLVIYLYDPFLKPVFRRFVAALEAALRIEKREIVIIYYQPRWRRLLNRSPLLAPDVTRSFIFYAENEDDNPRTVLVWRSK